MLSRPPSPSLVAAFLDCEAKRREAQDPGDIVVFPLVFMLIAGLGSLSAAVFATGRAQG
jgi:hypothetical protein